MLLAATAATIGASAAGALAGPVVFTPGDLVVSRSVYTGTPGLVTVGQPLPGGGNAVADGSYPNVFANNTVDGSFGVTSPIFLDQYALAGNTAARVSSLPVDASRIVTSFSSKSELALNLSADGKSLTFMGYVAPPNTLDVSNSNTPGVVDPTNPVKSAYYRGVAQIDASGNLQVTPVDAYSGNNGRAAIAANGNYYLVGNSNNGTGTPANVVASTGVQIATPGSTATTMVGNFSITQVTNPATGLPYPADKLGKDNNFRGETIFNNTLFVTKGSGGNGIDTVYQVGNPGALPTVATAASTPITILPGFPTTLAKTNPAQFFPFGLFFANANTLYVADEGDGTMANAGKDPNSGLEKWSLVNGVWKLDYTLQKGLNLGTPYGVAGYPASLDPATDGLRNLAGRVNGDGTVSLYAITSTVSASGDQGADPNLLVSITDDLAATTLPGAESFTTLQAAAAGEVLRGVAFAPSTAVPLPNSAWTALATLGGLGLIHVARRRKMAMKHA